MIGTSCTASERARQRQAVIETEQHTERDGERERDRERGRHSGTRIRPDAEQGSHEPNTFRHIWATQRTHRKQWTRHKAHDTLPALTATSTATATATETETLPKRVAKATGELCSRAH